MLSLLNIQKKKKYKKSIPYKNKTISFFKGFTIF